MKISFAALILSTALALSWNSHATVRYVDLTSTNPTPPFLGWTTAATTIQDAMEAAVDGDQILVASGVYQTGGKVMYGDLTNRVALDKAVTVQSVNGPWATILLGAGPTSGTAAVRCAWLTNGASLVGFTLQGGATRLNADSNLGCGGGVWCASSNAVVANCLILSNAAFLQGGGAFQGTIRNSLLAGNSGTGAGAAAATLNNCTVVSNFTGSGVISSRLTNCIVYYNKAGNAGSCTFSYSCTTPLASGPGNLATPPQLLADSVQLDSASPCIGAGTNLTLGTDLLGQAWSNPPSIGCAQWQPTPGFIPVQLQLSGAPKGFSLAVPALAGQPPIACWWLKNGSPLQDDGHYSATQTPTLAASGLALADAGNYQLVASNAFGVVTSSVVPLVVHCVDAASAGPLPPYTNWATAASTLQDAITAAGQNEVILVTNGVYATGGKSVDGVLTNRVCVDKSLLVASVNGPSVTTIQGMWDPVSTNGNQAVRCVWLTNGAALAGFTVQGGATRLSGYPTSSESGGGVWCASANAVVSNCRIVANAAYAQGGGVYQGSVRNSLLAGNAVAGTASAAYAASLNNCTVVSNYWLWAAANTYATVLCPLTNCIVYYNTAGLNYSGFSLAYCCTTPAPPGQGNFTSAPQLFPDGVHLTGTSPCLGTGTNLALGTDLFGRVWANPPSVGCAEWDPQPLVAQPQMAVTGAPAGVALSAVVTGQAPWTLWWLKDGVPLAQDGSPQTTNLTVSGIALADAGNYQLVVSNAFGVVTSSIAPLVVHCVDAGNGNPTPPYSNWTTAATNIQDALTAALPGEVVLVTNGLYATGGKSVDGIITNRVSVEKAVLVQSVNGPAATTIQGGWDPLAINGTAAIRCVWLTNNAVLSGFTVTGGATRGFYYSVNSSMSGGGVWGVSTNAIVDHCLVLSNCASYLGAGACQVTLNNSTLMGNHAFGGASEGGGAAESTLRNCALTANVADTHGGGTEGCNVINCSLLRNSSYESGAAADGGTLVNSTVLGNLCSGPYAGAVSSALLTNCLVWGNRSSYPTSSSNYYNCAMSFCCSDPLAPGLGNIDVDPQLLGDAVHLAQTSPCRGAGTNNAVVGTDVDGQAWNNPPAIGCDEWQPFPAFVFQPSYQATVSPTRLVLSVAVAGQAPFSYYWSKDGVALQDNGHYSGSSTATPTVNQLGLADAGVYQVVVSNAFGVSTSQVTPVVIHAVDAASAGPSAPYASWATAAATIQAAIDASQPGDIVLVTNGLYATGGKVMAGDLTNRVALDKPMTVLSVNGPWVTVIQGAWDALSTNGPGAVRCAWLTDGAALSGFTLQNGATRASGNASGVTGGGAWCSSTNALVSNCLLTNNSAVYGGGIGYGTLNNSLVIGNFTGGNGGGACFATLNNCTVVDNNAIPVASGLGVGTYDCVVRNSIVVNNYDPAPLFYQDNYAYDFTWNNSRAKYSYSCTSPTPRASGDTANLGSDPALLDAYHVSFNSPCRGAGSPLYSTGTDLEGEAWANPPAMGCAEVVLTNRAGPLSVGILASTTNLLAGHWGYFTGMIAGPAAWVEWSYGDGPTATNSGISVSHQWTNPGDFLVTFRAFNSDNPGGVSTNLFVHVAPVGSPQLQSPAVSDNFSFQFTGQPGANYTVQYATNLASPVFWQTLQSFLNSTGQVYQVIDPVQTNSQRFYRVSAQ